MTPTRPIFRWFLPFIWSVLLLVLAFLSINGLLKKEIWGTLAFASLVESVLLCFFLLLYVFITESAHISLKVAWCMLGTSSLLWLFRGGDAIIIPIYVGIIIGFPIVLTIVYLVGYIDFVLPTELLNSPVSLFVFFFAPMLLLGYWQWFWLLPRLVRWVKVHWSQKKNQ